MSSLNHKNELNFGRAAEEGDVDVLQDKPTGFALETSEDQDLQALAARGHLATDQYVSTDDCCLLGSISDSVTWFSRHCRDGLSSTSTPKRRPN
jgi:hypothetical protein